MSVERDEGEAREHPRRGFLRLGIALAGGLFALLIGIPIVGYILAPLGRVPPRMWVRVTSLDEIGYLEPRLFAVVFHRRDGGQDWEDRRGVLVIRRGEEILAFSNICTHMSCSVRWIERQQQILCPCHGGIYDRWGILAGGPPSRSLPFYEQRIVDNDLYVSNRIIHRGIGPVRA